MEGVEEILRAFIAENILYSSNGYPHADDVSFLETGVIDSMGVMELVLFIEERFDVKTEDQEIVPENFDSIRSLANYIRGKMAPEEKVGP